FVIDSLHCAGAEKSLTTLLSLLDYSKYDVDLQLFGYGGALEELVPKEVNILKPMEYIKFSSLSTKNAVIKSLKNMNFKMLSSRLKFSLAIRKNNYSNAQKARIYWQKVSNVIEENNKEYDIAISYAQGVPTFYVAEKVCAKKKLAWVNVSYKLGDEDRAFQEQFYDKYNKIVAVSDSAKNIFLETFPKYTNKLEIIYDINDANFIRRMSEQGQSYNDNYTGLRILTIGRLANQKGYDMALEACKILKEKGIEFKWYSLGIGPLKEEIEKYINENNLENNFKLLGVKSNPYPFIKDCDIYVQTSRFEGFGIAIAEARMLNKPVVTTRFDAVYNQMKDRKNGLVVDMNSQGIVNGILELINNKKLTNEIISYLKTEKKGNTEELEKFYKLIE
ncbi:MAG: glycosyltransferase, partial [Romboutsia sp.]